MPEDTPIVISGGSVNIDIGGADDYTEQGKGKFHNGMKKITRVRIVADGVNFDEVIKNGKVTITVDVN